MKKILKVIKFLSLAICLTLNTNIVHANEVESYTNYTKSLKGTYCNLNEDKLRIVLDGGKLKYKGYRKFISHEKIKEAAEADVNKAYDYMDKVMSVNSKILSAAGVVKLGVIGGLLFKGITKAGRAYSCHQQFKKWEELSKGSGSCGIVLTYDKTDNGVKLTKTEAQGAVFYE